MNIRLLFSVCFCLLAFATLAQKGAKLHLKSLVADTHNDILDECLNSKVSFDEDLKGKTHSDLKRFKEGGVDVQVFSIWCDGKEKQPYLKALRMIDTLYATANRNPAAITVVKNSKQLKKAVKEEKLAAMIGIEGGHMIENDLTKLEKLYSLGARYMTLTWNNSTPWATSALAETTDSLLRQPKGLNDFGKQIVRHMNELGMMVDLSHVGEKTFWDAIETTSKPVIVSHSCVHSLCPVFRNLKDDQIIAVGKNGGVIFLNFYSGFLDSTFIRKNRQFEARHKKEKDSLIRINPESHVVQGVLHRKYPNEVDEMRPPLSMLLDHLDYIVKLVGVDHVGLGSDFDGISSSPKELDDVSCMPVITRELRLRGYSKKSVRKILGGNFLKLLKANGQ